MIQYNIKLTFFGILLCCSMGMVAQTKNNSPYSISGVGILSPNNFMHQRLIGGLNTAFDSSGTFSFVNPATLSNTSLTNFEFGATYENVSQEFGDAKNDYTTQRFDYVGLGIPISQKRKIGLGLGLRPYSQVDYFIQNETVEDSLDVLTSFEGTGGLYLFQIGLGFQVYKGWSLGWNSSSVFGSTQSNIDKNYKTNPNVYSFRSQTTNYFNGFSHRAGVQYNGRLIGKIRHSLGASFGFETTLDVAADKIVRTYNSAGNFFVDTVLRRSDTPRELSLPSGYTIGYSIGDQSHWSFGLQYSSQQWSEFTDLFGQSNYFDEVTYRLGGFIQPNSYVEFEQYLGKKERAKNYFKVIRFYYGLSYSNLYMNSFNKQINELGINFGLGLPIIRSTYIDEKKKISVISRVNIGIGYQKRGSTENGLINENLIQLRIGTNFSDKWFTKRKYQ